MEKGADEFNVNCQNCGIIQKTHINDISASPSKMILVGGVVISIMVTLLLLLMLGAIGTITLTIPILMWRQQAASAAGFNSYRLRR